MTRIMVEKASPHIGAKISGVELHEPISTADWDMIYRAFLDHQVLIFEDQDLTAQQFKAFAARFGKPFAHLGMHNLGNDLAEVTELRYDGSRRRSATVDNKISWHTDGPYLPNPTKATLLMAKTLPPAGGDTMFANMYMAYETLHPAVRRLVDELQAHHAFPDPSREGQSISFGQTAKSWSDDPALIGVSQPVVVVHPETGRRSIYVCRNFTKRILHMPEVQSRHLLEMLLEHCAAPEYQYRYVWKVGSVVIWDDRCTLHYAVSDYSERREMWRVTVAGEALSGPEPRSAAQAALVN